MVKNSHIILRSHEFDGVSYVSPTWDQMGEYTYNLSKEIIESKYNNFDRVIALAKGGWTWARTLMDYIGVDEISSVRFKTYQGINQASEPQLVQPLTDSIHGQNILLFDEVIETGITIKRASEYLQMMGAKKITIASLCYKPQSCVRPNFYAFETKAWVIFPHEIRETIDQLYIKWRKNNVSEKEIRLRFDKIGIPDEQTTYFLNIIKSEK